MQPVIATTLFAVGQNCVRFTFSDRSGNTASAIASFDVKPPIGGFINTAGVAVVATDLNNIPQPLSANFMSVQQPGLLTAVPLGPPAPLPPALSPLGPAFDIRSTALAPPTVVVCFQLPGLKTGDKLFLFENGAWVDRTATVDTARSEICGLPTTLGVFMVGQGIPVTINVTENIVVTDGVTLLPSAMIGVSENIVVSDVPALLPSAMIGVSENIVVADTIGTTVSTPPPNLAASKQIMVFVAFVSIPGQPEFGTYQPFSTATVKNGDPVLFRLTATNLGGATTGPIVFTDTLAPGLTFLSSDSGCTAAGQVVTCTIAGPTAFNQQAEVVISAQLDLRLASRLPVTIENRVTVATAGDTDTANNTSGPVVMTVVPPPFLVPADITTPATSAAGAIVTYPVNSFDETIFQGPFVPPTIVTITPACLPASGSTFPIGTTTVTCTAHRPGLFGKFLGAGTFTVTVTLGAPAVSATVVAKGRDVPGSVFVDLRITNTGTGHARNLSLGSIVAQRLNGVGSVAYDAARSGALPIQIGSLDVGQTRVVRLYFTAPATVTRFSMTVNGGLQNVLGVGATFSIAQTIIP
jgi:uncharacterized repeat protein (TIGR01451 family)